MQHFQYMFNKEQLPYEMLYTDSKQVLRLLQLDTEKENQFV